MDREEREALGRRVRETWLAWAREQPSPKPSWLLPWEELSEPEREADRRIGEALAAPYDAAMTNATAEIGRLYVEVGRLLVEVADARCAACGGPVKAAEVAQLRADLTHVTAQRDLVRRAVKLVCLFDGVDDLHAGGCPKRQPGSGACNCGFDDALMGAP